MWRHRDYFLTQLFVVVEVRWTWKFFISFLPSSICSVPLLPPRSRDFRLALRWMSLLYVRLQHWDDTTSIYPMTGRDLRRLSSTDAWNIRYDTQTRRYDTMTWTIRNHGRYSTTTRRSDYRPNDTSGFYHQDVFLDIKIQRCMQVACNMVCGHLTS